MAVMPDPAVVAGLAAEIRAWCGSQCSFAVEPARLSGGFSSELFEFVLQDPPDRMEGPLVLRLQPGGDAVREQVIHATAASDGYPTPRPILWGEADSHFRRPYTIMRKLDGGPAIRLDGIGALKALREAPTLVAGAMARLHDLDPQPALAELEARGIGIAELGVRGIIDEIERADVDDPASRALDLLRRTAPDASTSVLVHGDLHPLNLWRLPDATVSVLDWEMATIGPPELDVARSSLMFSLVPGDISRVGRPLVMRLGRRTERSFRERYRLQRPIDDQSLPWYRALHALRLTTAVLTRPADDSVTTQWRPVARHLANEVEMVTGVRLPAPPST